MQAAPKAMPYPRQAKQVPYSPRPKSLHPSQPLPLSFFTFLIVASIILTPLALLNLGEKALITQNTYRIEELKTSIEQEKMVQERFKVEISKLKSSDRIQKIAVGKLHMVLPSELTFLTLSDEELKGKIAQAGLEEAR